MRGAKKPAYGRKRRALAAGVLAALALTVLGGFGGVPEVLASSGHIYDEAGLFTGDEAEKLEKSAQEVSDETGIDVVVVTTDDAQGKDSQEYADDFYDAGGFGKGRDYSGILYLIDMDNRELTLSTSGGAIRIFTDSRIDTILDHVYAEVADGDYAASAEVFLEDVGYYVQAGIVSGQYNYDTETGEISVHRSISVSEFLLAAGVSLIVAGIAARSVVRQYNMEENAQQIANHNMAYRADSKFTYDVCNDSLIDKFVTTAVIAAAASRTASRSSHSSSHSSGRSSTHHSSSGRSHGGGSRRF